MKQEIESPQEEAKWYAKKYLAKRSVERTKFLPEVLEAGRQWDAVSRSLLFFPTFQREINMFVPMFWDEPEGAYKIFLKELN